METNRFIAERMEQVPFSKIRKVFEEVLRREQKGEKIIHLEVGRPDFDTPDHIKEACKDALDRGQVHYTSNYGLPELRKAVAKKLQVENNIKYDPETQLIITSGVTEAIFMGMMALLNPGDEVLVLTPCFPAYNTAIRIAGAKPIEVPLNEADGFKPDVIKMQSLITPRTRMLIVNTPCNPTGAVYDRSVLEALAKMAIQNDLLVMSDEIYEKMVYNGAEHISMASLPGMASRTLTLNGFSKNYSMTGWRIGYVAAPSNLIGAMLRIRQYVTVCPTSFAQWGAVAALTESQACLQEMVAQFSRRRELVYEKLSSMKNIHVCEPRGAFYVLPNVSKLALGPTALAHYLLDEAKIAVVPWGEAHIRISYANSYENLQKAMQNMNSAIERLQRSS
ncbi:MAG: pyridoxal phosphate-dependent aminotransferase [Desulfobacterales bacterium]|nr:pyridoxal phosphate-dependent aminotransferase [Desulfobacterales bacterium]